jgi:hypothetical protein
MALEDSCWMDLILDAFCSRGRNLSSTDGISILIAERSIVEE